MWLRPLNPIPSGTKINFVGARYVALIVSVILILGSVAVYGVMGLNYGIDFKGGIMMEVRTPGPAADLSALRDKLGNLDLGEVALQVFGAPTDVLIRLQRQVGAEAEQLRAIEKVKAALGPSVEYRRTEFVGPKVGGELIQAGMIAIVLSMLGIAVYVWFRFEWQFGVGAIVSLLHDVVSTIGVFALMQYEFNLATVAAVLTVAGYSINDTVVVFDRIRENLRKYKQMPIAELLNLSVNETLSRTIMTSGSTMVAVLALYFFGGEVLRGFSFAMAWGIVVGTYSSIYVAAPCLLYFNLRRVAAKGAAASASDPAKPSASEAVAHGKPKTADAKSKPGKPGQGNPAPAKGR